MHTHMHARTHTHTHTQCVVLCVTVCGIVCSQCVWYCVFTACVLLWYRGTTPSWCWRGRWQHVWRQGTLWCWNPPRSHRSLPSSLRSLLWKLAFHLAWSTSSQDQVSTCEPLLVDIGHQLTLFWLSYTGQVTSPGPSQFQLLVDLLGWCQKNDSREPSFEIILARFLGWFWKPFIVNICHQFSLHFSAWAIQVESLPLAQVNFSLSLTRLGGVRNVRAESHLFRPLFAGFLRRS